MGPDVAVVLVDDDDCRFAVVEAAVGNAAVAEAVLAPVGVSFVAALTVRVIPEDQLLAAAAAPDFFAFPDALEQEYYPAQNCFPASELVHAKDESDDGLAVYEIVDSEDPDVVRQLHVVHRWAKALAEDRQSRGKWLARCHCLLSTALLCLCRRCYVVVRRT